MKKALLSLFLLFPFIVNAQYFPLVKEGGIWRQTDSYIPIMPGDLWEVYRYQYKIDGDTTINGIDYKKLYSMNYDSLLVENINLLGAIREDSLKRVYYLDNNTAHSPIGSNNDSTEILLYDFSLNVGDTLFVPYTFYSSDTTQVVESIDSTMIEGQWRKRINFFQTTYSPNIRIWIEGIGDLKGLFFPLLSEFEDYWTLTCYEDNNIFWTNPELQNYGYSCFDVGIKGSENIEDNSIKVYPDPCYNNINFNINYQHKEIEISIYNSLGNMVQKLNIEGSNNNIKLNTSSLNNGIYYFRISGSNNKIKRGKFIKL